MRKIAGVVLGAAVGAALAITAGAIALRLWPAYAAAEPTRAYTAAMLVGRLVFGAASFALGSVVCTRIARDAGQSALVLGALVFAFSAYHHIIEIWPAYPVWYHAVYLGYLLPIAAMPRLIAARRRITPPTSSNPARLSTTDTPR